MPSKPGRPPVSTSFKKGNTAALGNDKTMRLSTWIDKALDDEAAHTVGEYESMMSKREILAKKIVDTAITTKDPGVRLSYGTFIADRTEGKPTQPVDVTSKGERLFDNASDEQLRAIAEGRADLQG